jgi:hypothetical protein
VTLDEIKALVRELDAAVDEEEPAFRCAVVLLAAVSTDACQDVRALADLTGYDTEWIAEVERRLVRNGVWKDGVTYGEWTDDETGGIGFWMDVSVGLGLLERS